MKKLITNLTHTDIPPLILRLKGEKQVFTFEDVEKESGIKLTSADRLLVRSVAEKKFKVQVVCEAPGNQLKFFPKAKELSWSLYLLFYLCSKQEKITNMLLEVL